MTPDPCIDCDHNCDACAQRRRQELVYEWNAKKRREAPPLPEHLLRLRIGPTDLLRGAAARNEGAK